MAVFAISLHGRQQTRGVSAFRLGKHAAVYAVYTTKNFCKVPASDALRLLRFIAPVARSQGTRAEIISMQPCMSSTNSITMTKTVSFYDMAY